MADTVLATANCSGVRNADACLRMLLLLQDGQLLLLAYDLIRTDRDQCHRAHAGRRKK